MLIRRTIKIIAFLLPLAILYVYQNTEVFKLAYKMQQKANIYKELLERNSLLKYNYNVKSSIQNLDENLLSKEKDLKVVDSVVIVKAKTKEEEPQTIYTQLNRENRFLKFFSPPAEAESRR